MGKSQSYITQVLHKLVDKEDLTQDEAANVLREILKGEVSDSEISAFLFGMRSKGETTEELTAFVKVMREASVTVEVDTEHAVDLCGTGGDNSGTFNISTAAMFVVAGAGVPVLKHGNRSVSSKSGSYDVLESLGVKPALSKEHVEKVFNETGMAFMFAPLFHPAMKHVMNSRRSLKMRTFFNILGPLLNPANVKHQVIGAFNKDTASQMANILSNLDMNRAYTVNASDGLDEFSVSSESHVFELKGNVVSESRQVDPESMDFSRYHLDELKGGDKDFNARLIKNILKNRSTDAQRDIVLLNAIFAIHVSGKAETLQEARKMAEESLFSGKALDALNRFAQATQSAQSDS